MADEYSTLQEVETGGLSVSESRQLRSSERSETMEEEVPRMHVLVAITFTVSWVLFCAALFKHVEVVLYFPYAFNHFHLGLALQQIPLLCLHFSAYSWPRRCESRKERVFFIILLPHLLFHRYMLLFFAFVMIGLSLVSMCINVIQNSIEDFYKRLLAQMLENYKNGHAN